jgi:hypothetical protein
MALFPLTSWYSWEDGILPSGLLLPRAATGERGIADSDRESIWVSGVPYALSRHVFLAPEHRIERLARNYGRRSYAVIEFPIEVLDGRRWTAVEHGRRKGRWTRTDLLARELSQVEMILTPDPLPLSAVRSVVRVDSNPDEYDELADTGRTDYDDWREYWWAQAYSVGTSD